MTRFPFLQMSSFMPLPNVGTFFEGLSLLVHMTRYDTLHALGGLH
jgi:hypothetical protein